MPPLCPLDPLEEIALSVPGSDLRQNIDNFLKDRTTESVKQLVLLLFFSRDRQTTIGRRDIFRDALAHLSVTHYDLVVNLLEYIPAYGYWGDVFWLAMNVPSLFNPILSLSVHQIKKDEIILAEGGQPSLFAKWVPKQGKKNHLFASWIAKRLYPEVPMYSERMASYRRRISRLNRALNTVEILQCANRWDEIIPSHVPKICLKKNIASFLNAEPNTFTLKDITEKRMTCRTNFLNYLNTPTDINNNRARFDYSCLMEVVDKWAEGGWRTT